VNNHWMPIVLILALIVVIALGCIFGDWLVNP
jgi:hypothetical protein